MIQNQSEQDTDPGAGPKWFNSPVSFHKGTLTDIRRHIPTFERRSFSLLQPGNERSRINERLDTIVRQPFGDDKTFVPVGVVSKGYSLVPHEAVLDVAVKVLNHVKIELDKVKAEMNITEYGERMEFSLYLPDKYNFDPGDNHKMALRLECLNSVDGSTRFRALMGWFRYVCRNGLIIGVTRFDVHRRHVGDLQLEDIGMVLKSGLKESETEKKNFKIWREKKITIDKLVPWVDSNLREKWGFKAAARAFHIIQSGYDAEVVGQYKGNTPTNIAMKKTIHIPWASQQCSNLFDLCQILAWLAKERRDVQEQLQWREGIPDLMKPLMN